MADGLYVVSMLSQTVVADETLVIIHTPSSLSSRGSNIDIIRMHVSQDISATSQQLGIRIGTKASAFGTYTSTTPASLTPGGSVSGITGGTAGAAGTAGTDASAEGAGTFTDMWSEGFNNLAGWNWIGTPEERIVIPVDTAFAIKLRGTPTTLTNWNAFIVYRELT